MDKETQGTLPTIDEFFLSQRLAESRALVKDVVARSSKPLIVQFSGGNDSMAMVSLVREVTGNFICSFMVTGIEFPEAVTFAQETAAKMGFPLLVSTPQDHLGGFFERLPKFGWPTVHSTWCNRDLKVRPQRKRLVRDFGEGQFYKLVGVRKFESTRRKKMHKAGSFFATDYQTGKDTLVYPLLKWTSSDVKNYLKAAGLPVSSLYKRFGVSGCYWCPFYQVNIYKRILHELPNLYDEFIEWENQLGAPSVIGEVYLRDLKKEVLSERRTSQGIS